MNRSEKILVSRLTGTVKWFSTTSSCSPPSRRLFTTGLAPGACVRGRSSHKVTPTGRLLPQRWTLGCPRCRTRPRPPCRYQRSSPLHREHLSLHPSHSPLHPSLPHRLSSPHPRHQSRRNRCGSTSRSTGGSEVLRSYYFLWTSSWPPCHCERRRGLFSDPVAPPPGKGRVYQLLSMMMQSRRWQRENRPPLPH